ncbi:MAG: hypothetical protein ABJC12_07860 [Saprospiraceae bacterium]
MKKYNTLIFFFSVMTFSGFGQHFTFHSKSPFGIEANEGTKITTHLMFFDIDGDGDLDLFITGIDTILNFDTPTWNDIRYFIDLQENIGDKAHPLFAQRGRAYEDYPYPLGYFFRR